VAIKEFKNLEDITTVKKTAFREVRILNMLKHLNIVSLLEVHYLREKVYLVFEYIESTVLERIQNSSEGLDSTEVKKILYQLLLSLNHCHSLSIIHRDIKPENLLLSSKGILKLCDFGFARTLKPNQKLTDYVSTRWYRAPELLVGGKNYSYPVDIWPIGCLCAELITGKPLFPGTNDIDTLAKIVKVCGNLTENLTKEFSGNLMFQGIEVCFN
jgi:cyclin-dependent kinase-like